MHVIHGTWIPGADTDFENQGRFCLWVESSKSAKGKKAAGVHPFHVFQSLASFLFDVLPLSTNLRAVFDNAEQAPIWFNLPSDDKAPLPSVELARFQDMELNDAIQLRPWKINCLLLEESQAVLTELHFVTQQLEEQIIFGHDLLFWYHADLALRKLIKKDSYIPTLIPRLAPRNKKTHRGRSKKDNITFETGWMFVSSHYEDSIARLAPAMPVVCRAASWQKDKTVTLYEADGLLRHYAEQSLSHIIRQAPLTQQHHKLFKNEFIENCIVAEPAQVSAETWQQWRRWRDDLVQHSASPVVQLGFRLESSPLPESENWHLQWLAIAPHDPSLQITLDDYWQAKTSKHKLLDKQFGKGFHEHILRQLGQAARIYPMIWDGLNTDRPTGLSLNGQQVQTFLTDRAWVLEEAGFKVIVPAWWTPKGRVKARLSLKARSSAETSSGTDGGYFALSSLVQYNYQLSVGGEPVSEQEWRALVDAKSPLVQFRGQWILLDRENMANMLGFWQQQSEQPDQEITLVDLLKRAADEADVLDFSYDESLADMIATLQDSSRLALLDPPKALNAELRAYQLRGLSWLRYLESLGLGACLADDMGLGKTIQVIALLVHERAELAQQSTGEQQLLSPTLLIAPTSVLGNWEKEMQRFAPHLKVHIHHSTKRHQTAKPFKAHCLGQDLVITSYALARKDAKLFEAVPWLRLVIDEAQNIKNPKSALSKAIFKLSAPNRIALTGTPIENRLLDLWSIFHFLNPGYLDTVGKFKKSFETPIRKNENASRALTLKRLVQPFILRRLKTDKNVIKDLPEKIEQKIYCNLSQEQASLYEAVVKDVQEEMENAEGMKRKGLILSTLMRLKQICNHPAQFLQDGSEFSEKRSLKFSRVAQMVEEVMAEGESLLLFTQFTDVGKALASHFRSHYQYNTYYLHGATSRAQRDRMIDEFQAPETEPSLFILSLKAGGVGITLTKANHVFHFDRWWNPAVENQATDRAFRIGQTKQVFVHKMVVIGTLEERIDEMLEDKKRLSDSIVGNDESWLTELDNDAFRELIELKRESVLV